MAQPSIPGIAVGIPRMVYGNDGTNWIAVLVDALGHIQADILSSVLPTDAAKETKQDTMITALQLIDDLRAALGSVNTDDLQVDVKTSALPSDAATETTLLLIKGYVDTLETLLAGGLPAALDSGALKTKEQSPLTGFATSANQDTMVTALQLIDDLRAALGSVATDKVLVASKSGDKIFGFESIVEEDLSNIALATGYNDLAGTAVPSGKVWRITNACIQYRGTVPTSTAIAVVGLANTLFLLEQASPASERWYSWSGEIYLQVGDRVYGIVNGATLNDDLVFRYAGVQMNAP